MWILVPAIRAVSPSTMQSIRLAWPQIVNRAEAALPPDSAEAVATVDAALATLAAADSSSPISRTNSTRPHIRPHSQPPRSRRITSVRIRP